jgi:Txe/YoeB family toxin of Txe-Axe toxin-antitoxin module
MRTTTNVAANAEPEARGLRATRSSRTSSGRKHRLVYLVRDERVDLLVCRYHY